MLARRTVAAVRDGEQPPAELLHALRVTAEAVAALGRELAAGTEPVRARELTPAAVASAGGVYRRGLGFSSDVVVAQVRTIGTDLLLATGLPSQTVTKLVRRAVGRVPARSRPGG